MERKVGIKFKFLIEKFDSSSVRIEIKKTDLVHCNAKVNAKEEIFWLNERKFR